MKDKILKFWPILAIFLLVVVFAFPYWAEKKIPFPADYLVNAFPPWQYYYGIPVKNNAMPDVVSQMYPWKHLAVDLWKKGIIPLWNPYNFSGNPLLGNYQSAVLHPFNFLFFLLPEIEAWSLLVFFQPLLAGLFTYLFCRQLKLSQLAALLGSISFMFSGFITVWMAYGTMAYALLWLPLILYGIERSFAKISAFPLALISFSLATSFFSGHFQISLYVFLFALAFLLFKLLITRQTRSFFICLLFLVLGCLLATPQVFPTLELHQFSVRSKTFAVDEIIPWSYLVTLIAPDFYGNPVTRNDWFGHYAEWRGFLGVIPLILALYVVVRKKDYQLWFFALAGIFSLLFALPTPLLDLVVNLKLPVLSTSAAARIICLFSFSFAILAGFGLEQLKEDLVKRKLRPIFLVTFVMLVLFGVIWLFLLIKEPFGINQLLIAKRNLILPTGMAVAFLGLIMFFWLVKKIFKSKKIIHYSLFIILLLLLSLSAFDLFRFAKKWMPFESREYVYPSLPILEFLTQTAGADRPVDEADRLFGYFGMEVQNYYQVQGFNGYDPLYIERYGELLMAATDGKIKSPSTRGVNLEKRTPYTMSLLNLLGGKYILHAVADDRYAWAFNFWDYPDQFKEIYRDEKYEVYENLGAFPRAFMAYDYQVVKEPQAIIDQLFAPETDLRETLILEEEPGISSLGKDKEKEGAVSLVKYSPNRIELAVETETPGLLFLSDNYYPGWQALIDNEEVKIYRADYSFRAIPVSPGKHQVLFRYDPLSFKGGLGFAFFSLVIILKGSLILGKSKK